MNYVNQTNPGKYARSVSIIGVGCTPFRETLDNPETAGLTEGDLFGYAALSAMEDAGITPKDVDFYYHGCASPLNGSNYLTPNMQVAEWIGMRGKASVHHSEACCTGYLALDEAVKDVASGKYNCVLTACVEFGDGLAIQGKPAHIRKKFSFEDFQTSTEWLADNAYTRHLLCNIGHDNAAAWYMEKYGLTSRQVDEALCMLAVNARHNALGNPLAIDNSEDSLYETAAKAAGYDDVLEYMLSSNNPRVGGIQRISGLEHKCDGAAAVIVCATDMVDQICKSGKKPIEVLGIGNCALEMSNPFLELYGTIEATRQVYNVTGVKPEEIDLMYINDFIITSQLLAAEVTGYIPEGQAWKYVMEGRTNIDGDKPINPNGGRTAFGHAHAASGLADFYDAVKQMRGEAIVHSATGKSHNKQLQLDSFGVKQGLAEAARAIHNGGAYASIQLSHGGKYGGLASIGGDQNCCAEAYGPSAEITPAGPVQEMPRELILEIVESYGKAAKLCKDCGFDMVQVHAAHGWLFSQFLSFRQNRRTDEFGGSLSNRARFMLMAIEAVRKAVGPGFPIELRISGDDLSANGLTAEECLEMARLVDGKVDLINVSCGNHEDPELFCRTHPSFFYPHGVNVQFAAAVRKVVRTPVTCVGALNDPAHMEQILADGEADCVELGRALLADPFLPQKAAAGDADDITPCLRCFECFAETSKSETVKCTVNPRMGEQLWVSEELPPAKKVKKVLVAGGGPAGMEAALTAAARGHKVILAEKTGRLGGNMIPASRASFKSDLRQFLEVMRARVAASDVQVLLNTEVDPALIRKLGPDSLVVAVGADAAHPPIPGLGKANVRMAVEAEFEPQSLGQRVAIIGGGLVGCELAISLKELGRQVCVIEMRSAMAADVNPFYRGGLMPQLEAAATLYVDSVVRSIADEGVVIVRNGQEETVYADSVVCAVGFRTPDTLVDELCAIVPESYVIGDCGRVGQIYQAMNQGYYAGRRM